LLAVALLCSATSANAEYRLNAGDVIEVIVAGVPELKQRVTVQVDGTISLPLLGTIFVGDLTSSEARGKIQSALATKVFRQTTADGRERPLVIKFDEVAASIVEYRPVYVSGDVSKAGQLTYRPYMTVRQAVAAAGGYGAVPFNTSTALREAIDLQADYASLWVSFAKEHVHVWRLRSELGDEREFDPKILKDAPLSQAKRSEIMKLEAEQMKVRKSDFEREKAFLTSSIKQAGQHIAALEEQVDKDEQGAKADLEDLKRVTALFEKGTLSIQRIAEARRAVLLSSTRLLQTRSRLMQVTRDRDEFSRRHEKLYDQRRIELLRELQDAGVKLSEIQTKLHGIGEKLRYTTRPQATGQNDRTPEITVFRKGENGEVRFIAKGDTELQPGDVVEVVLRTKDALQAKDPNVVTQ